ncbi:uncharacterized protein METZ01_LOCUS99339, partial [marine metagenome]
MKSERQTKKAPVNRTGAFFRNLYEMQGKSDAR